MATKGLGDSIRKIKAGILVMLPLFLSSVSFGQIVPTKPDTSKIYRTGMDEIKPNPDSVIVPNPAAPVCPKPRDYCTLQKGKMFCVKNAVLEPVNKSIVLVNGTSVSVNGKVKTKEGKTWQLKEGEQIDMNGNKILPVKAGSQENSPKESRK
jgi:hypothetical protein